MKIHPAVVCVYVYIYTPQYLHVYMLSVALTQFYLPLLLTLAFRSKFCECSPPHRFANLTYEHYNTQKSFNGRNLRPVCRKFSRFSFVVGLFTLLSSFAVYG